MQRKIIFLGLLISILPNLAVGGNTVSCDAGYYLPANSTKKEDCKRCLGSNASLGRLYCPGGKNFYKNFGFAQGIQYCGGKLKTNSECDEDFTRKLDPGKYFPAREYDAVECTGTNLTEAQKQIKKELDAIPSDFKEALSMASNFSVTLYYEKQKSLAEADVGELYCPGAREIEYDWKYPSGIQKCDKKYVFGENNQKCADEQPSSTVDSSTPGAVWCNPGYFLPKDDSLGKRYTHSNSEQKDVCTVRCGNKYERKDGYACIGSKWYNSNNISEDQGLTKCGDGQIVDYYMTGCISCLSGKRKDYTECEPVSDAYIADLANRTLSCDPGSYMMSKQEYIDRLKKNSKQTDLGSMTTALEDVPYCMSCFDWGTNLSYGYRCPGVKNKQLKYDKDGKSGEQGKEYCPEGQVTTRENPTTCVDIQDAKRKTDVSSDNTDNFVCPVGHIWDNGKCEACSSKPAAWLSYAKEYRMYCPGVLDISLPITSQLKKCPNGAWPNNDLTDCECGYNLKKDEEGNCVGTLSYNDLYYGPFGSSTQLFRQCWTKVSAKAYKKCMGFD